MIQKAFASIALVASLKNLKVYESCTPSKKQEQLNCKEVNSVIQMRTYFMLKNGIILYNIHFSGLTETEEVGQFSPLRQTPRKYTFLY